MSDARDKKMVKKAIDKELSFLTADEDLAEKIVNKTTRRRRNAAGVTLCAALCILAVLLCVVSLTRPKANDIVSPDGTAATALSSANEASEGDGMTGGYTPREFRFWCPVCQRDTVWKECCLSDSYTEPCNEQTELKYHEDNGVSCGYYEIRGNNCTFCDSCGNVQVMNFHHTHAVVHENCGAGAGCPIEEYWEAHKDDSPGYLKALQQYRDSGRLVEE